MPQIRCPQCGAINDTRAPDYPFCIGCQDNLAKCGYCQWFNDHTGLCTHPAVAGVFEVSEDATPPCGYHTPRHAIRVRREGRLALVVGGLAAAIFVLGYAMTRLAAPVVLPAEPQAELQLAVEADYDGAVAGEPYLVMAQVYNTSDSVVGRVRIEIAKEFLDHFDLREVRPQPSARGESRRWQVLAYPEMNPRERRTIALELVPKRAGRFHLVVGLVSGEHFYHGMADLPIIVKEPAQESEAGRSREGEDG